MVIIRDIKSHYDWYEWLRNHGLLDREFGADDIKMGSGNTLQQDYDTLDAKALSQAEIEALIASEASSYWKESYKAVNYVMYPFQGTDPPTGSPDYPYEASLNTESKKLYTWSGSSWDSGVDLVAGDKIVFFRSGSDLSSNSGDNGSTYKVYTYDGVDIIQTNMSDDLYDTQFYVSNHNRTYTYKKTGIVIPAISGYSLTPVKYTFYTDGFTQSAYNALKDAETNLFEDLYLPLNEGPNNYQIAFIVNNTIHLNTPLTTGYISIKPTIDGVRQPGWGGVNSANSPPWNQYNFGNKLMDESNDMILKPEQKLGVDIWAEFNAAPTTAKIRVELGIIILDEK